jgi:hypothetical protein
VIGVEEATTLTQRKFLDISTCCRTSKPNWRPRIYTTTNPGGVGHTWYKKLFIDPHHASSRRGNEALIMEGGAPRRHESNGEASAMFPSLRAAETKSLGRSKGHNLLRVRDRVPVSTRA